MGIKISIENWVLFWKVLSKATLPSQTPFILPSQTATLPSQTDPLLLCWLACFNLLLHQQSFATCLLMYRPHFTCQPENTARDGHIRIVYYSRIAKPISRIRNPILVFPCNALHLWIAKKTSFTKKTSRPTQCTFLYPELEINNLSFYHTNNIHFCNTQRIF